MKIFLALCAFAAPAAALAADNVTLDSKVFVERQTVDAEGKSKTVLEPPKVVTPGDRLLFVLSYKNIGAQPATDFVVTNPIPSAVAYANGESGGALVSVDGGQNWGPLASLKVSQADGTSRAATAADVTHVRWALNTSIPAGQGGDLSFRGVVK